MRLHFRPAARSLNRGFPLQSRALMSERRLWVNIAFSMWAIYFAIKMNMNASFGLCWLLLFLDK